MFVHMAVVWFSLRGSSVCLRCVLPLQWVFVLFWLELFCLSSNFIHFKHVQTNFGVFLPRLYACLSSLARLNRCIRVYIWYAARHKDLIRVGSSNRTLCVHEAFKQHTYRIWVHELSGINTFEIVRSIRSDEYAAQTSDFWYSARHSFSRVRMLALLCRSIFIFLELFSTRFLPIAAPQKPSLCLPTSVRALLWHSLTFSEGLNSSG